MIRGELTPYVKYLKEVESKELRYGYTGYNTENSMADYVEDNPRLHRIHANLFELDIAIDDEAMDMLREVKDNEILSVIESMIIVTNYRRMYDGMAGRDVLKDVYSTVKQEEFKILLAKSINNDEPYNVGNVISYFVSSLR